MSTPRTPNQKKQYAALNARLNKYTKLIEQLYAKYNREAAAIALRTDYIPDDGKMFRFKDYPQTRAAINELLTEYAREIVGTINRGTAYEWRQSNEFQDLLANKVLRGYGISDPKVKEYHHYYQTNSDQLKAFQQRQISGMTLSQRVWDLRSQYKEELEMALSVGIEQGVSANALASQMKKYLNDPDKLFRRVRDEFGNLQLSKNAKAYHPGRGVYRSSFKNAQRLTRSEINMAYRTAEQERWRQFDFVVGYEIKLSQRHPCHDVCDELAGRYPKDFVWTGWHPNDMCYAVSILKTDDEFWRDLEKDPDEPKESSVNEVTDLPDGFKDWVADNADRIEAAGKRGTQPYFIRDNREAVDEVLKPKEEKTIEEIAAERHAARTPEQINDIQMRWQQKVIRDYTLEAARYEPDNALVDAYISSMRQSRLNHDIAGFEGDLANLKKYIEDLKKQHTSCLAFSDEQRKRFAEMEKAMKTKRGVPMTLREADEQKSNPNFKYNSPYSINCQTCAPAYVLRSQGFNVIATGNTAGSVQEWISRSHSFDIWENADGTKAKPTLYRDWLDSKDYKQMTPNRYKEFYEAATKEPGIYITTIAWKGGGAHATIIQRFADGSLAYIEPQVYNSTRGMKRDIMELCNNGKTKIPNGSRRGIMRVDDKLLKKICKDGDKELDIWSIFGKE